MTTQEQRLAEAEEIIAEGVQIYDRQRQQIANLRSLVLSLRSEMLVAASRIRAYQSPAYDDRHDYQRPETLKAAHTTLMDAYTESAELLARLETRQ